MQIINGKVESCYILFLLPEDFVGKFFHSVIAFICLLHQQNLMTASCISYITLVSLAIHWLLDMLHSYWLLALIH